MQITETANEGLKREYQVTVPAADLEQRMVGRLSDLKGRINLHGFRPGKVPETHLRKLYGRSVMAETVEDVIRETNAKIVEDRGLRLAMEPKVTLPTEEAEVNKVIGGEADLAYTVALEVLPVIELGDFKSIKLDRLVTEVTDAEIDEAVGKIADANKPYSPKGEGENVASGDRVTIDFTGRMDGKVFEGGTGGDVGVNVGSGTFIPGFEEQLVGMGVGEQRLIKVTFPANYQAAELAGKEAEFDVTAKSIDKPGNVTVDDEFAKSLGLESMVKLREAVKDRIAREHTGMSRQKLKRALLDKLDEMHKFTPPPTLVEDEFANVWKAIEEDLKQQGRTFADEGTTEEKAREEYRAIAERRVRLGLVLADIGEKNGIKVTDEEVSRGVVERARQFPGQEQQVWDYYRKNPNAIAAVRAPIYEEKVVDFLTELATVTDKTVSREELYKDDDADVRSGAATPASA